MSVMFVYTASNVRVRMKIIPWQFCILNPKNSRVIYPWILYFTETVGYYITWSIVYVCL